MFWLHMASFSLYSALVGYLLIRNAESQRDLTFFFFAMALHFLVTDFGLRDHHRELYDRLGRWLLSLAVLWAVASGWLTRCPPWRGAYSLRSSAAG